MFYGISGALQGCFRGFRGIPGIFKEFQWGVKSIPLNPVVLQKISGVSRTFPVVLSSEMGVPEVFYGDPGLYGGFSKGFRLFQGRSRGLQEHSRGFEGRYMVFQGGLGWFYSVQGCI